MTIAQPTLLSTGEQILERYRSGACHNFVIEDSDGQPLFIGNFVRIVDELKALRDEVERLKGEHASLEININIGRAWKHVPDEVRDDPRKTL